MLLAVEFKEFMCNYSVELAALAVKYYKLM